MAYVSQEEKKAAAKVAADKEKREDFRKGQELYINYLKATKPDGKSLKTLTKDAEGILAPDSSQKLSYENISMIFIPCLAVDKNLTRLGYGGGYFDRLREDEKWRAIPCIGVLTSNCISDDLLTRADWDIPLSGFITENEILV